MKIITVDIETYSPQDISEVGLFRYAQDPEFQVLLFGYVSEESDIPKVIDLTSWPDTKHFLREQLHADQIALYHLPFAEDDTEGFRAAADRAAQSLSGVGAVHVLDDRFQALFIPDETQPDPYGG